MSGNPGFIINDINYMYTCNCILENIDSKKTCRFKMPVNQVKIEPANGVKCRKNKSCDYIPAAIVLVYQNN